MSKLLQVRPRPKTETARTNNPQASRSKVSGPADMKPFGSWSLMAFPPWGWLPSAKIKALMKALRAESLIRGSSG
ncbi:hypothetical protein CDV36_001293 [Fusarium kuroshium]|uniref:Uncharacterized protein n=1 Tax=Fusarium kuroshium TaxID=2010991 RepID=A0A3M2SN52_9HYPO|nr:hypothetical protein CDV36_001293 [Fusarium kuroshium]